MFAMQGFGMDSDYSWVRAKMQRPVAAPASVESCMHHKQYYADPDEALPVFSAWILFDQKTVMEGGNGRLIDRCRVASKKGEKRSSLGKIRVGHAFQIGFKQGSRRGYCILSCLLQQITGKQGTAITLLVL